MIWLLLISFIPSGITVILPGGLNTDLGTALSRRPVCNNRYTFVTFETPIPDRQNQYNLNIDLPNETHYLDLKFDSEATLVLKQPKKVRVAFAILTVPRNNFRFILPADEEPVFNAQVFGTSTGNIPYIQSILADGQEICPEPEVGYLGEFDLEEKAAEISPYELPSSQNLDESCGRRKVEHTELIRHGKPTKSGDWPWHVAISRIQRSTLEYICGGTLLSKTLILTAAHCASIRGSAVVPESLNVDLGKYNLIGGDFGSQIREVFQIIIHPEFNANVLNNDIALLRLRSEAVFTDYVQPACLWNPNDKLVTEEDVGTVVGWGFNHQNAPSSTLQKITIPILSEVDCLKSNPIFFHKKLDKNKFCAGFANGTSVCNGDSGGGLMIFVPDTSGDNSQVSGSWYVRGIVSFAQVKDGTNICDPEQYTIFTDVSKYRDWLLKYLE